MTTTALRPFAIWKQVVRNWSARSRRRCLEQALIALGERMCAVGIDDGQLGAQIASLDRQLHEAHPATADITGLKAEWRALLMRLAAAALEEDAPLPGADAEYERARQAQAALTNGESNQAPAGG